MKSKFSAFVVLFSAILLLASCLKSNDNDVTYYNDTAITAFSLGTLNKYVHVTSSTGGDSIAKAVVSGSSYKFYIDQINREIYNPDSLPMGVDVSKVLCTISSKNSGTIVFNMGPSREGSDSLVVYSSTDSIDFTVPREVRVYNMQSTAYRSYKVRINVHQEVADSMNWRRMISDELNIAQTKQVRVVAIGNNVYGFGLTANGENTWMMNLKERIASENNADKSYSTVEFGADAINNIVAYGNRIVILDGSILKTITLGDDGTEHWSTIDISNTNSANGLVKQLVGISTNELYALSTDGSLLVSVDNGISWTAEQLDTDKSLLPIHQIRCTVHALNTNVGIERVMLTGLDAMESQIVSWTKIVDTTHSGEQSSWLYVGSGANENFVLPVMYRMSVFSYDQGDIAFGCDKEGVFNPVYISKDGGISWQKSSSYEVPKEMDKTVVFDMAADNENYIWLVCGGSGQIWCGRLNRLGWSTVQKAFTN